MKQKRSWRRSRCAFISTVVVGLGIQCFAHAGFAVNDQKQDAAAVYAANASDAVPKFLSKKEAVRLGEGHKDFKVVIAYNIDEGRSKHLSELPEGVLFFYNPYSQKISAALTKEDAVDLAQVHQQVFFAVAGETLSQTIKRWALSDETNSYQVYWASDYDYKIQFPFSFHGDLLNKQGPLDRLLESFANRDFALTAEKTPNHVLVIKDRVFQQKVVSF